MVEMFESGQIQVMSPYNPDGSRTCNDFPRSATQPYHLLCCLKVQNKAQLPGLFNPRTFIQLQLGLSPGQIGLLGNDFGRIMMAMLEEGRLAAWLPWPTLC